MKALAHVVPRSGAEETFDERVRAVVGELRGDPGASEIAVNVMFRLEGDPFGKGTRYRTTIEIAGEGATPRILESLLAGLGSRLDEFAHPDLSTLLVGEDAVFLASERASIRFQYLMRRNARFTHASYLKRYREVHSAFGLETPGILGYVQFHVDVEASTKVAQRAGLGVWGVDSVSELHLESLEIFLEAIANSKIGGAAIADEEVFVDRANSRDFCSWVEWDDRI